MNTNEIRDSLGNKWAFGKSWRKTVIELCGEVDKERALLASSNKELSNKTIELEHCKKLYQIEKAKSDTTEKGVKKLWQFIHLTRRLDDTAENGSIREMLTK